jgi:RND family efflux transporter MFP subunit
VARAACDAAKLDLEFTRITAPLGGQIGRPLIDAGNTVRAGETQLAILVSTDPVYADFDVDERTLLRLRRAQQESKDPATSPQRSAVFMGLADEDGFPHQGRFDAVDSRIDEATGTLGCRAVFPNPKGLLVPGMFARVRLPCSPPAPALLLPDRAIGADTEQRYVFVVNEIEALERRPVETGAAVDGLRVIRRGLSPGDWVVIDGPQRLTQGAKVKTERTAVPTPK